MATFMTEDFLLKNDIARTLYHKYAAPMPIYCNFAFFSGLIGAQFWAERAQPKSPELDAKLLVSC